MEFVIWNIDIKIDWYMTHTILYDSIYDGPYMTQYIVSFNALI